MKFLIQPQLAVYLAQKAGARRPRLLALEEALPQPNLLHLLKEVHEEGDVLRRLKAVGPEIGELEDGTPVHFRAHYALSRAVVLSSVGRAARW